MRNTPLRTRHNASATYNCEDLKRKDGPHGPRNVSRSHGWYKPLKSADEAVEHLKWIDAFNVPSSNHPVEQLALARAFDHEGRHTLGQTTLDGQVIRRPM